VVAFVETL
jgi:hypothetical protein